ncbi:galactose mutarotase [Alkalihalobacillus sp. MEB130]|uniref:aldose epimerase family protein n=1 Tax=Alkalihalobacillus sp. MEB130 TaxID=2976704 RepID=UPI0028DF05FA|nr:aldose epimerase family protein [Alkalihalobacillus sp. MEB130]MDT8858841.1 galactose mutarotase [Alkalihalobacillus sp. MEB130]
MNITQKEFGLLNGKAVTSFTLKNNQGIEVTCINYGCIITNIMTPNQEGRFENIVLGFDSIEEYVKHGAPYYGAVVGRVAGRMKKGQFELEGKAYSLPKTDGDNHLHGGVEGFSHKIWIATVFEKEHEVGVEFTYHSEDGEEGYPGNLDVKVTYTLTASNKLIIKYEAESDQTTLVNLTNHSYFNLSGNLKKDVLNHVLTLPSNQFLELASDMIPTGKAIDVEGTPFDFRKERRIGDGIGSELEQIQLVGNGYDHPFLLQEKKMLLKDEESGRVMTVETDEPCVVLYTGNHLKGDYEVRGVKSENYLGLCLETQGPPDSIHHPQFSSCILRKGELYQTSTTFTFGCVGDEE